MSSKTKLPKKSLPVTRPTPPTPPWTTEERRQRIEAMGLRINNYVQFMCQSGNQTGASTEATDKAVLAFYEQMVVLERELALIHDSFQLE